MNSINQLVFEMQIFVLWEIGTGFLNIISCSFVLVFHWLNKSSSKMFYS
jgi:hypothetical protein